MKISIVVPAYNAGRTLEGVIARVPGPLMACVAGIWIINDGSTDDTREVAGLLSEKYPKVRAMHFGRNRGYGAAIKAGLAHAKNDRADFAVCIHADGQYPPELIGEGIEKMASARLDIMQGSRIASGTALSGGMPLYKFTANRALTFLENIVFAMKMTDYHSGMLFYGRKALETLPFARLSDGFDFDVEVIALCRARGLAIGEMPIPTHYGDEVSHLHPIGYGFRVLGVIVKYLAGRYSRP